jgi:hypothetical protein
VAGTLGEAVDRLQGLKVVPEVWERLLVHLEAAPSLPSIVSPKNPINSIVGVGVSGAVSPFVSGGRIVIESRTR